MGQIIRKFLSVKFNLQEIPTTLSSAKFIPRKNEEKYLNDKNEWEKI